MQGRQRQTSTRSAVNPGVATESRGATESQDGRPPAVPAFIKHPEHLTFGEAIVLYGFNEAARMLGASRRRLR